MIGARAALLLGCVALALTGACRKVERREPVASARDASLLDAASSPGEVRVLANDRPFGSALAIDATHLYWARIDDGDQKTVSATIVAMDKRGGAPVTLANARRPGALAVDATTLYWTSLHDGSVHAVPKSGGDAIVLAGGAGQSEGIAVDADHVYFTDRKDGTVARVPKRGGAVSVLASKQPYPVAIAVDDTHVYWVNLGGISGAVGSLARVLKVGGPVTELASGLGSPGALALDGEAVIFAAAIGGKQMVARMAKQYAIPSELAAADGLYDPLAIDGVYVYYFASDGERVRVLRVPKHGGGDVNVLAQRVAWPLAIVADESFVFFTESDQMLGGPGRIVRIAR